MGFGGAAPWRHDTRVVIVGAGFAGLHAATSSATPVQVTLVDRHNFSTFQPLLYQVATAGPEPRRRRLPRPRARPAGSPTSTSTGAWSPGVDWAPARSWSTRGPDGRGLDRLPFDYLIVATGADGQHLRHPGRRARLPALLAGRRGPPPQPRPRPVRGGQRRPRPRRRRARSPSPWSAAAPPASRRPDALAELVRVVFHRDFPRLPIDRARILLLDMAPHLLGPFGPLSQRHALETLRGRGVEVRLGRSVKAMTTNTSSSTTVRSSRRGPSIWSAGIKAGPFAGRSASSSGGVDDVVRSNPTSASRVGVDASPSATWPRSSRRAGRPGSCRGSGGGTGRQSRCRRSPRWPCSPGATPPVQILRDLDGQPGRPFTYRDKGIMATIGRHSAVTELPFGLDPEGVRRLGGVARPTPRLPHRVPQPGVVLLNWAWNYVTYDRGPGSSSTPTSRP